MNLGPVAYYFRVLVQWSSSCCVGKLSTQATDWAACSKAQFPEGMPLGTKDSTGLAQIARAAPMATPATLHFVPNTDSADPVAEGIGACWYRSACLQSQQPR
jgi:hypothetical protein